jgi:pyruvate/2-oxoglutarate dehydrogenase complex dihydrolipoamide dehydrogenase (E3) component
MSQAEQFDIVVLGSGQGGKLLAWHLGRSGKKVAVVERRWVGGSCPAVACLPSKNELWSARVAHLVQNAAQFGTLNAAVRTDMGKVRQRVDERLKATSAGVWAIGECAGSPQFTHVSVDDFRIVRDNMEGGNRTTGDRLVPYVMFTDPPLARVGLSEGEARLQGIPVRVAKLPMSNVLRTEATDETGGFMKVVVGADNDTILGFTMIGSEAGEVMAAIQAAMLAALPYTKLRDAVIAHLTWPKASVRSLQMCRRRVPPSAESLRCSIMRALCSDGGEASVR